MTSCVSAPRFFSNEAWPQSRIFDHIVKEHLGGLYKKNMLQRQRPWSVVLVFSFISISPIDSNLLCWLFEIVHWLLYDVNPSGLCCTRIWTYLILRSLAWCRKLTTVNEGCKYILSLKSLIFSSTLWGFYFFIYCIVLCLGNETFSDLTSRIFSDNLQIQWYSIVVVCRDHATYKESACL